MTSEIKINIDELTNAYNDYKLTLLKEIDKNCNNKDDYINTLKDDITGWNIDNKSKDIDKVNQVVENINNKPKNIIIYKPTDDKLNKNNDQQLVNTEIIKHTIDSLQNSLPKEESYDNEKCFIQCKQDVLTKNTGCDFKCNLSTEYINNNIVSECNLDTIINNQNCFVNNDNIVCIYDNPKNKCKIHKNNISKIIPKLCTEDDNIDKRSCIQINNTYYCTSNNVSLNNNEQCNDTSLKKVTKCYMK